MTWAGMSLVVGLYVLLGRWLVGAQFRGKHTAFALLNLAAIFVFLFFDRGSLFAGLFVAANLAMLLTQYIALRSWGTRAGWLPWLAFFVPIGALVAIRYIPISAYGALNASMNELLMRHPEIDLASRFIGLSYLAFRTSHLVLEVRNGIVKMPSFGEYVGFALFAPTLLVGPISPYSQHQSAFTKAACPGIPTGRALLRVLVGVVKYKFFGPLLSQLAYAELLLDGHPHPWIDLPVAVVTYYLFLYCNFSGFCDLAIGVAGLMGIPVAENFDHPFAARNMKDFWNRWHLTLSQYMRDVLFSPLSQALVRVLGPARVNHAIALTIFIVFLLVGVWHGAGWNYAAFGLAHALGVVANHYYTVFLKKRLRKEQFVAYNRNRVIQAIAVALTFIYAASTLFLFANDFKTVTSIFSALGKA